MRTILFNDIDTAKDWHLILNEKTVSPPKAKTNYVSVPGRDGALDLSESLSDQINYESRTANFTFLLTNGTHADRDELITEMMGKLHGQRVTIVDSDDYPDYYMTGRTVVTSVANTNAYGTVKVEATLEPWRMATREKKSEINLTNDFVKVIVPNDGYKIVTPTLEVSNTCTIRFAGVDYTLTEGTFVVPDIKFRPGITEIRVKGSGSLVMSYREGIL